MSDFVCPGCGNTNEKDLKRIRGHFTIEVGDWHTSQEEISIYACTKCSCLQVNDFHFNHIVDLFY
jgi:hypothetical protein